MLWTRQLGNNQLFIFRLFLFNMTPQVSIPSRENILRCMLVLALIYSYIPVVVLMVGQWVTNDVYSYCLLIPVISGYLVWMRRKTLRRLETIPDTGTGFVLVMV